MDSPSSESSTLGKSDYEVTGGHQVAFVYGIDLAKHSFSIHGEDHQGKLLIHRTISRSIFLSEFAHIPPAIIGIEAYCNPVFSGTYQRLLTEGKPKKWRLSPVSGRWLSSSILCYAIASYGMKNQHDFND